MAVSSPLPFIAAFLNRFGLGEAQLQHKAEEAVKVKGQAPSSLQQQELETLCAELFKKRSLVTSGKLQLIGLEKVKRRLGRKWPAMQQEVYAISEEVISTHLSKGDIHLRQKDDTYLIIFAAASREQGELTATAISEEIRERLFATRNEDLRGISIKKHIVQTKSGLLSGKPLGEILDSFAAVPMDEPAPKPVEYKRSLPSGAPVFTFIPLWEVRLNAVTTYLCRQVGMEAGPHADLLVLSRAIAELQRFQDENRPALIMCPVRHATLSDPSYLSKYELLCRSIPVAQRDFLIFKLEGQPQSAALSSLKRRWRKLLICRVCAMPVSTGLAFPSTGRNNRSKLSSRSCGCSAYRRMRRAPRANFSWMCRPSALRPQPYAWVLIIFPVPPFAAP